MKTSIKTKTMKTEDAYLKAMLKKLHSATKAQKSALQSYSPMRPKSVQVIQDEYMNLIVSRLHSA